MDRNDDDGKRVFTDTEEWLLIAIGVAVVVIVARWLAAIL